MRAVRPYLSIIIIIGLVGLCALLYTARHLPAQVTLNQKRAHWTKQHLQNYRYTLTPNCFCTLSEVMIEVQGGAVKKITRINDGQSEAINNYQDFAPIDHLFGWIDQRLHSQVFWMAVDYDPTSGYPEQIEIRYRGYGYDDAATFIISDFQSVK